MKYAKGFRESARSALQGKWGLALGVSLVAAIFGVVSLDTLSFDFKKTEEDSAFAYELTHSFFDIDLSVLALLGALVVVVVLLALAVAAVFFVLGSIVEVGHVSFYLKLIDGNPVSFDLLFSFFSHWKQAVKTNLWKTLKIFLWALLLIVPGILKAYSYAMTPYILAENPDMPPKEVLERSQAMMYGNRCRLFCLQISFIGWHLLCILSLGIGSLWLNPYIETATADFYREISGTRIVEEPPVDADAPAQENETINL